MHIEIIQSSLFISLLESFSQINLKNDNIVLGVFGYSILAYFLYYIYKNIELSTFNITWSSISIILATIMGYFLYKESITDYKILSIISAILAIYFSNLEH